MKKVDAHTYQKHPDRYTLVSGYTDGAPRCPFGNKHKWVGFDLKENKYIRYTKSIFKKLVKEIENETLN